MVNPQRFARLSATLERRQPDLTVLMDGVHKPHNFSAILRSCDAAGALGVHVVVPQDGLDLHHGTAAGTQKWLEVHRHRDVDGAAAQLRGAGFQLVAAHPSDDSVDFREVDYTAPTALVLGAELHGVSEEALRLADRHVVIPMSGMAHSLNVSVAAALLLFEAKRQREAAGMYARSRIPKEELERRLFEWAYPEVAAIHAREGRAYPRLSEDGEILAEP